VSIRAVLAKEVAVALGHAGIEASPNEVHLERPARLELGDWSTNAALVFARRAGATPRELASRLAEWLREGSVPHLEALEVAGPGFLNFRLRPGWLHDVLAEVVRLGERGYARPQLGGGERVQVEFVSANPTGPLHVGNGWWGAYGDALARLLERCGWEVTREYYVNDTGGQIRELGRSLLRRRRGEAVHEGGYQGEYVTELAARYDGPDDEHAAGRFAAGEILEDIRRTLESIGVRYDVWYSQASLEESGQLDETLRLLEARGFLYEKDGALWLESTALGDTRDRVLKKADGDYTYLAGDLAYHRDKFLVRNFDRVIDVFGADHHGHVASLKAGVQALGVDPDRLEVRIGQLVSLVEAGESGRMSKRAGNVVRLSELVEDLGADAVRLLSLMSSIDQPTTLDLDVVRRQSMENPVYYVQYAHARIASIERVRAERGIERPPLEEVDLGRLVHERELDVLRALEVLPDVVEDAATTRAPHKVTTWVRGLAGAFHGFYHDCPVLAPSVPQPLAAARLWLVEAARIGLVIGLGLLGVHAPEAM
jgi:arginyl-tRNA synthetase